MSPTTINRLQHVPIFSELSKTELRSISRLMTSATPKKGRTLTSQGRPSREFMIILEGKADVIQDGRTVATLTTGDFLGESVLTGEPRSATVIAATDMLVEVLTRRELTALLDEQPVVAKKMLLGVLKRYQALKRSLRLISQP